MGKTVALSPARRIICDVLEQGQKVPLVSVARLMNLRALAEARQTAAPRPSWNSIFTKGYAKVAAATPELRRVYVRWPWARLYEHHCNIAGIAVEAEIAGEKIIVPGRIVDPQNLDLITLDQAVVRMKREPGKNKMHRQGMMLARLPHFLRAPLWALALDWSGRQRVRKLGTFGVTSVAFAGGHDATFITPLANVLHYGIVDSAGNAWLRIGFDHRIMDGAAGARALVKLEELLNTEILPEVRALRAKAAA